MRVLLITMVWPKYGEHNLYSDLMQEFMEHGHQVTVAAANEKRNKQETYLSCEDKIKVLRVKTGNIQKTNKYNKVIFSFIAGPQIIYAIHKHLKKEKFDLILFSTPPITLSPSVILLKRKYHAKLYLLLKDIWPQDTVDVGGMKNGGLVWSAFRYLEKLTYKNSDYIGCMSPACVNYIRKNNRYLKDKIIEVCPNSQKSRDVVSIDRDSIREKYDLPKDKIIFVYGGNLGKSQGVEFLIDMIQEYEKDNRMFYLIVGSGTEYDFLYNQISKMNTMTAKILPAIPKNEFEDLIRACDVGLILLHKNSTVPNFPSRLLTYLAAKIPIIAVVDKATDMGDIIEAANCGIKAYNGDISSFKWALERLISSEEIRNIMGENGNKLFLEKYTTNKSYEIIMQHFNVKSIKRENYMSALRSFVFTYIYIAVNFICYGDLPTSYYVKKGMKVGRNLYRQNGTKFDPSHCYLIEIGDNVTFANNVQILAHDQSPRTHIGYGKVGKVVIGNNAFIGAKALILSNVVIGDNVIIGAGSVVTKDIPANSVAVGIPARVIGTTEDYITKCKDELRTKSIFDKTYGGTKVTDNKKNEVRKACKEGYAYINLGKVIDYSKYGKVIDYSKYGKVIDNSKVGKMYK